MQSFQVITGPPAGQKNYVFVDEHNRHKRLKVMRACEGCRRRKIKCDSATTNIWPCSACTRLKLSCIPPATGTDGELADNEGLEDADDTTEPLTDVSALSNGEDVKPFAKSGLPPEHYSSYHEPDQSYLESPEYQKPYIAIDGYSPAALQQFDIPSGGPLMNDGLRRYPPTQTLADMPPLETMSSAPTEQSSVEDISEQLGDLMITENGIAKYARQQAHNETEPEAPIQEQEEDLRQLRTIAGSQIRIPPALMPANDEALHYFNTFFKDIHPYLPVLNRNFFYHQWHADRSSISPLLLEAVFACAGKLTDNPGDGSQWLSLANGHEASFLDKPRLSTVQALLLLLKAREGVPKRGYYYRSWMTCKTAVSMAKDLELQEHFDVHQNGEQCGSDSVECLAKTRVWQTLLVCEMMIGGSQGRSDMGVDPKTVDISPNPPCSEIDEYERGICRQFAYFVRNARNIRLITDMAQKLKRKENWGLDKDFVAYNMSFGKWPSELPPDLQVPMPSDGSPPQLLSHFVGNMHTHYQLGVVMLHRPQLLASKSFANDSKWRNEMSQCYNSAKILCKLQEGILNKYGATGLLCMVRGINFTVYAILTCTMIHLIALTSPDPEFRSDARDYFTRHMQVLEQCHSWSMPETQEQINQLRSAFSEDLNLPFRLKSSFSVGSPSETSRASITPPRDSQAHLTQSSGPQVAYTQPPRNDLSPTSFPLTTPLSTTDTKQISPQAYMADASSYPQIPHQPTYSHQPTQLEIANWNPTPIINQFNVAFSIPQSALAPPPPQTFHQGRQSSYSFDSSHFPQPHPQAYPTLSYPQQSYITPGQPQQVAAEYGHTPPQISPHQHPLPQYTVQAPQPPQQYTNPAQMVPEPTYVSARDWQQSVATVMDSGGLKRRWGDFGIDTQQMAEGQMQKRMR